MLRRPLSVAALMAAVPVVAAGEPPAPLGSLPAVELKSPAPVKPIPPVPVTTPKAAPPATPDSLPGSPTSLPTTVGVVDTGCALTCAPACGVPAPPGPACWGSAEYLFYFLKDAPSPVPLATTGPVDSRGVLGQPGTRVVLGGREVDYGQFSGMRFTLGGWLNDDRNVGIEASAFLLEELVDRAAVVGGAGGLPVLARPFTPDTTVAAPNARVVTLPGRFDGGVATQATARLWGAEVDPIFLLTASDRWSLAAVTGFRFLNLEESLAVYDASRVLAGGVGSFNGNGFLTPGGTATSDFFSTQNRFYGGTLGARLGYATEQFVFGLTGKVSLGSVNQTVNVAGSTTLFGGVQGPLPATVAGGLLAVGPNSGRFTRDEFVAVPEVGVKVGYRVTRAVALTAGYDFLYVSNVARPGDQINLTVNPTTIPTSPTLGVPFGPRSPSLPFTQTDFWAHGASVGVVLTY